MSFKFLFTLLVLVLSGVLCASPQIQIQGAQLQNVSYGTRLVLDVNHQMNYYISILTKPQRIVINIPNARLSTSLSKLDFDDSPIIRMRNKTQDDNNLQVILDMKQTVFYKESFARLAKTDKYQLIIDLNYYRQPKQQPKVNIPVQRTKKTTLERKIVIAIDAGHGGDDPGSVGKRGTKEKDIVLAIAKRIKKLTDKTPGVRGVLVRKDDRYVGLRERINIAHQQHADLLVSIHADAFHDTRAQGASVYILSQRGASSEAAQWLANKENKEKTIANIKLHDKEKHVAEVLLDLTKNATKLNSQDAADRVLNQLSLIGKTHKSSVQNANFVVLKSLDIPSILIETAFLSSPEEERKLLSVKYQNSIAEAVFNGLMSYFIANPPQGTLLVKNRKYIIKRGDTLAKIAKIHQVSIKYLRNINQLDSDRIFPGQVLNLVTASN